MRRIVVTLLLLLACPLITWGGLNPTTELNVFRFYSQATTNTAQVAVYKLVGDRFQPKQIGNLRVSPLSSNACSSLLLGHLQNFSLSVMKEVGYINDAQEGMQKRLVDTIHSGAVTFLTTSVPVPFTEVYANPTKYPVPSRRPVPDDERPGFMHINQSGLWVIASQHIYADGSEAFEKLPAIGPQEKIHFHSEVKEAKSNDFTNPHLITIASMAMPWQYNRALIKLGQLEVHNDSFVKIDRKKYPLAWEFGRAAQVAPEHMDHLMRSAMSVVEEETLVQLQSRLEDAYIFVKALDEKRKRRFALVGFRPLDGACPTPDDCVMVAPYLEIAKHYPPGQQSFRLGRLQAHLKNISERAAKNILLHLKSYQRADLDLYVEELGLRQKSPLVVQDSTVHFSNLVQVHGQRGQLQGEELSAFVNEVTSWRSDFDRADSHLFDVTPLEPIEKEFTDRTMIRVTNLDPDLVSHPYYLPMVLLGVEEHLISRYQELGLIDPEKLLADTKTSIAIQSSSKAVVEALKRYPGFQMQPLRFANDPDKIVYTFVFSRETLIQMKSRWSSLRSLAKKGVHKGFWFFRGLSAHPLKF
jgi:hypothetical protein